MQSITEQLKPKKEKPVRASSEILEAIQATGISCRKVFAAIRGSRLDLAELERRALENAAIATGGFGDETFLRNQPSQGSFLSIVQFLHDAAACKFYLAVLEGSAEGRHAIATLEPLFSELETALENERNEAAKAAAAAQELRDAKAAALVDLQSKVDQDPAVIEAQRKLEPFRRLGHLVEE
jgi:hypothetical protein